jgi:hypothetical protein
MGLSGSFGIAAPDTGGGGGGGDLGLTVTSLAAPAPVVPVVAPTARSTSETSRPVLTEAQRRRKLRLARTIRIALARAASVSAFCRYVPRLRGVTTAQVLFMLYPSLLPPWAAARRDAVTTLASIPGSGHLCLKQLMTSVRAGMALPEWNMLASPANPNPFRDTLSPSALPPRDATSAAQAASISPALALLAAAQGTSVGVMGAMVPGTGGAGSASGPKHTCWRWHLDYADRDSGVRRGVKGLGVGVRPLCGLYGVVRLSHILPCAIPPPPLHPPTCLRRRGSAS